MSLFSHLQNLSLDFYGKWESGRIVSRLTNDVDTIYELVASGSVSVVTDCLTLVGIVVVMVRMNAHLAMLTFLLIPVLFALMTAFRQYGRQSYRRVRAAVASVTGALAENINGVRVVKAFSREDRNLSDFNVLSQEVRVSNLRSIIIFSIFWPLIELVGVVGSALVLGIGGREVIQALGVSTLQPVPAAIAGVTTGTLVAFLGYVNQFFEPIRNLSRLYNTMQAAMAGAERVFDILDTEPLVKEARAAGEMPSIGGKIEFRDVTFEYVEGRPVLDNVSFTVKPGETVALVGPTGAGKSTIVQLVARMYDVTEGVVLIDGVDVRDVTLRSLRSQMGTVLQDPFLFSGTVADNIRYARPEATDEEVEAAAKAIGAHEFIEGLPEGYNTPVMERGSRLSAGQRQLISFARALLANPRILILDEATSSIDGYTELRLQQGLRQLLKGRTALVIAHRLSTIVDSDRVMVIEQGKIAESGKHEELLARGGLYERLYTMQFRDLTSSSAEK
jgi:ABC-type multidrug transport system fused ATPase/permease subunit